MTLCALSSIGLETLTVPAGRDCLPSRFGTITGETVDGKCWYVRWDGETWPVVTRKEFVRMVEDAAA